MCFLCQKDELMCLSCCRWNSHQEANDQVIQSATYTACFVLSSALSCEQTITEAMESTFPVHSSKSSTGCICLCNPLMPCSFLWHVANFKHSAMRNPFAIVSSCATSLVRIEHQQCHHPMLKCLCLRVWHLQAMTDNINDHADAQSVAVFGQSHSF